MGDQAAQAQSPTKSQDQTQTSTETKTHNTAAANTSTTTTTAAAQDPTNSAAQTPSPPSKLPSRPRKIRKLSPTTPTTPTTSTCTALIPRIIARPLSTPGELETALRHLKSADPSLSTLIDHHQPPAFNTFQPPFLALAKSILYQQLAYKAGTSIYTRFISLCGSESNVLPDVVLALTPQQLRQIGVSARKSSYLHDLARKYQNGILSDKLILEMDDKSLFTMLTMVNGIGSWSVHMFMIFSLHRPDVLPIHDLGIRKGVQLLLGLEELPRPSQMDHLCEKWRPYRSVAAWYVWRFVETKGANSNANGGKNGGGAVKLEQQQQQEQQQQEQQQHQQHQQFMDPIHGILNLGACAWGQ